MGNINHITDEPSSIIAVQTLGTHPYYTWVKADLAPQKKSRHLSLSRAFQRRRTPAQTMSNKTTVMWLHDLLPNLIPNARIATYSYVSDWRYDVKVNLRKCGEEFLNALHQHRIGNMVSRLALNIISPFTNNENAGKATATHNYWA